MPEPRAASFFRRVVALVYDLLLVIALIFALSFTVVVVNNGEAIASGTWWYNGLLAMAALVFYSWFWVNGGQTLGMKAWKIRVVTDELKPLSWSRAALRGLAGIVCWAPFALGFLWMLIDGEQRTVQDRLSGTRVVDLR